MEKGTSEDLAVEPIKEGKTKKKHHRIKEKVPKKSFFVSIPVELKEEADCFFNSKTVNKMFSEFLKQAIEVAKISENDFIISEAIIVNGEEYPIFNPEKEVCHEPQK